MKKTSVFVTSALPLEIEGSLGDHFTVSQNLDEPLTKDELGAKASNQEALICNLANIINEELLIQCPSLKVVANVAVGFDNIDVEAASRRNILITNTPGVLDDTTADLTFALLLALSRRLDDATKYLHDGKWQKFNLNLLFGVDVHHKTLGIIGMGRIGQAVARRARGFSMRIIYSQRHRLSPEVETELGASFVEFEELLKQSDFITLHCPSNKETFRLLGERQFNLMKPSCQLINAARGSVIDEQALLKALTDGRIAGAGLDVFENEPNVSIDLLKNKNVLAVPHIGSATKETRTAMALAAVESVKLAFKGVEPASLVNKECWPRFIERLKEDI